MNAPLKNRRIALYEHVPSGDYVISTYHTGETDCGMYVRVSEPVEVDFTPRIGDNHAAARAAIEKQIAEAESTLAKLRLRADALPAPEAV